ncbi:hypothetical protein OG258_48745 [Streptomyces mirabilis]|uniref:hypothetical protein n=1 Tax=Streptomyces mirabilis TaxID=68239 RepID=UPI002E2AEA7C|nr:hypothetical protein [Streptomyces mirabilis]
MTSDPAENDHLPVYESLVRERGDAVAEARLEVSNLFYRDPALYDSVQPDLNARSPGSIPTS